MPRSLGPSRRFECSTGHGLKDGDHVKRLDVRRVEGFFGRRQPAFGILLGQFIELILKFWIGAKAGDARRDLRGQALAHGIEDLIKNCDF